MQYRDRVTGDVFVIIATLATYAEEPIPASTARYLARKALRILPELPLPRSRDRKGYDFTIRQGDGMTPLEEAKEELMDAIMRLAYEYGRFSMRDQLRREVVDAIELVCARAVEEVP
jgi:hypothetical protein